MESNRYTITLGDQQILNAAFYQRIKYLPVDWNVHGSMFDKNWRAKNLGISNRLEKEDVERAVRDPAIIHYTYKRKPWLAPDHPRRSEEHTSELQSLMRISYAVFCLKKKT